MKDQRPVEIELTPEQKEQIRRATGQAVTRLTLQPLEPRLAPGINFN